jgi:hypothetical protein
LFAAYKPGLFKYIKPPGLDEGDSAEFFNSKTKPVILQTLYSSLFRDRETIVLPVCRHSIYRRYFLGNPP